jgi:hypothetical protein
VTERRKRVAVTETLKSEHLVVLDDVLPEEQFRGLLSIIQREEYFAPYLHTWRGFWEPTDGPFYRSQKGYALERNGESPYPCVIELLIRCAREHPDIISQFAGGMAYSNIYPAGSRLSWHRDGGGYSGAFVFYVHHRWSWSWGGNLVIPRVETRALECPPDYGSLNPHWEDEVISDEGVCLSILPKPDRLVLLKPGTFHMVERVDANAGRNLRCSINGFFER